MEVYGYVRVSTRDQHEDRQMIAMEKFPVCVNNIFLDKLSGKDFNRPGYQKMLKRLKKGDLVVIKSIDRLGRDYNEILEQWRYLSKVVEADIVVIDMPLLDTRSNGENLTGRFISDLVLQILSYVAQTERENIRKRQAEGISAAMNKGVRFGRPPKPVPANFGLVRETWKRGEIGSREAARRLGVSQDTFLRWCRKM